MFSFIWHTFFFDPIYNGLIFFIDVIPGGDVGLAIIATTVCVKIILLPLSIKGVKTQVAMQALEPKLAELKKTITDRQEQARAMMALYKEAGVNPLITILLLFIQSPIFISLYFAVNNGGGVPLPDINTDLLYFFIPSPDVVSMLLAGMYDITARSLPLALLAGATQFIQVKLSLPKLTKPDGEGGFKAEFARNMQMQMLYVLPIVITFISYTLASAIALYFVASNTMGIIQEFIVRRHRKPATNLETETVKS